MQEIVLILSSLAGVATAAAVRKMPRERNQLLSLGASSHIKGQISTLRIEKEILTKTISRLYQTESEFSKIQKDKLLLKYQHQLGIILAKLEKLEQASKHPDLGPVGDGLITLMDQKLSKLDERLYELSSKIPNIKVKTTTESEPKKQERKQKFSNMFNFDKPKTKPVDIPTAKQGQSFELTTLTNIPSGERPSPFEKPITIQTETVIPKVEPVATPKETVKPETVQTAKPTLDVKPDLKQQVAKINEHKALAGPTFDNDDFDEDTDDLDKIKNNIMKVLSKLDDAEVE